MARKREANKTPAKLDPIDLMRRANRGDRDALDDLLAYEREHGGPLVPGHYWLEHAQSKVFDMLTTKDSLYSRHMMERETEAMVRELEGPNPTPLESVLVRRVVACRWMVAAVESQFASLDGCPLSLGEYWDRRVTQAHRRLLQAIKALAEVRRLQMRPSFQLNIAEKQVNVGGDVRPAD